MNQYTITVTVTVDVEAMDLRNAKDEAIYQASNKLTTIATLGEDPDALPGMVGVVSGPLSIKQLAEEP